jgi:hypothetical protein
VSKPQTNQATAFQWNDPFLLEQQLDADERAVRAATEA